MRIRTLHRFCSLCPVLDLGQRDNLTMVKQKQPSFWLSCIDTAPAQDQTSHRAVPPRLEGRDFYSVARLRGTRLTPWVVQQRRWSRAQRISLSEGGQMHWVARSKRKQSQAKKRLNSVSALTASKRLAVQLAAGMHIDVKNLNST